MAITFSNQVVFVPLYFCGM